MRAFIDVRGVAFIKNNRLCVGLALLTCVATALMHAQPGSSAPAQNSADQGSSLSVSAKVVLGLVAVGLGYGLCRRYKRWAGNINRHGEEPAGRTLQESSPVENERALQVHPAVGDNPSGAAANAASLPIVERYDTVEGVRLLCEAAQRGDIETVRALLEAGADANGADIYGETPLHWAASRVQEAVARMLLKAGADVNAVDSDGRIPLHIAAMYGHEVVVRILLDAGADVTAVNGWGSTPLHWAARNGYEAVVRVFLAAGADVNAADSDGETPLYLAAGGGRKAVARLLAARGAVPLTQLQHNKIISDRFSGAFLECQQPLRIGLGQIQVMTERASLERKKAIEDTLDGIKIKSVKLPRDLQRLVVSMSEHSDVLAQWRHADRVRTVSRMRLPDDLLEHIVTFDAPQDIGLFRRMLG